MAKVKYFPPKFVAAGAGPDNDLLDKTAIYVHHLLTDKIVKFKSFVTSFNDDHQAQWSEESVYGRMDSIATFQSTKRMVTITFDVPSYSEEEAVLNLRNVNLLKQFLYPLYEGTSIKGANALAISSSPLVRVRYANLIVNNKNPSLGLLCLLKNVAYSPVYETGEHGYSGKEAYNIIAKQFSLSLSFNVLHEHRTGWTKSGSTYVFADESAYQNKYPYIIDNAPPPEETEQETPAPQAPTPPDPGPTQPDGGGTNEVEPKKDTGKTVGTDPSALVAMATPGSTADAVLTTGAQGLLG
jgi:hypothetical protein